MMAQLMRNQRLKSSKLEKFQDKKLRAMIKHCYRNVEYYHFLFKKANLSYGDIKTIDDLEKIPITRKEDIKDLPQQSLLAVNVDPNECYKIWTSGTSSGIPLLTYFQKSAKLMAWLQVYRWQLHCGDKVTNRRLVVGVGWVPVHPIQKLGIFKSKSISVYDNIETQIREAREFDPHSITCFPSFVEVFANEIAERDEKGIKPSLIFTGGEMLFPSVRRLSQEVFGAEVFDSYGSVELGVVASECIEHVGHHIDGDSTIVEITRDGETMVMGEEGEITVTNLTNYAMPLVRYNLGDLGFMIADHCSCGVGFPMMKITSGRKGDLVRLSDGKTIPAFPVWRNLAEITGIKQLQVVQERADRFIINIVKSSIFTTETCREAEQKLRQSLGNVENVEIAVYIRDEIKREKSGKLKHFVTKIPSTDD